jgi:methyltransferase-like protein/protein-L-isoaspartate O-methyltransferase
MNPEAGAVSAYDQVLYPAAVFPQTHPNRLATVAFLRGLQPAPIQRCRVLELGCGVGSNLIAMAFHLPESDFIGLDLARRPIASGQALTTELGLQNIRLHCMDVRQATIEQFGQFDYIIAHGLYSWVPEPVRDSILTVCREMLAPQGVAYVSYNAYPGNHLRDLVRGMMRFHIGCFTDPAEKIGQARGLLKFLAESTPQTDYYVAAIRGQFERTKRYADEAFFHDDLSEVNQSFYFHEFNSEAERHGLQFVGEASANDLQPGKFNPPVLQRIKELEGAPEVVREQYKDFIRGSAFRQTLLCHQEVQLAPDILIERIPKLYASCDAVPQEKSGDRDPAVTLFVRPGGAELETTHPLICAALKFLWSKWPGEVSFEKLLGAALDATANQENRPSETDGAATLVMALAQVYRSGFLHMNFAPHQLTNVVSQFPSVSRLARFQLEHGESATNQLHVAMNFPEALSRRLVQLLDGTRDREMLKLELVEFVRTGDGALVENGKVIDDLTEAAVILERRVAEGLESLAREGMLVS